MMLGRRRTRRNRRSFTLLEIFICLAIVACVSVVFGLQGKKLFDAHRYESSIKLLRSECEKAQFLSLVYRADVELRLAIEKKQVVLLRKCEEPGLHKEKGIPLPGIADFRYRGNSHKSLVFAQFSSGFLIKGDPIEIGDGNGVWKTVEILCNSQAPPLNMKARSL